MRFRARQAKYRARARRPQARRRPSKTGERRGGAGAGALSFFRCFRDDGRPSDRRRLCLPKTEEAARRTPAALPVQLSRARGFFSGRARGGRGDAPRLASRSTTSRVSAASLPAPPGSPGRPGARRGQGSGGS
jgi:hypothetical protein